MERFPPKLGHHPPVEVDLDAPDLEHWSITLDRVFSMTLVEARERRGVVVSTPGRADTGGDASTSGGQGTAPGREQALREARVLLDQVLTLRFRSMQELGSIREVDRILARTLMAEFSRIHLIVLEDLTKSLLALKADFQVSGMALVSDVSWVMDLSLSNPRSVSLRAALERFQRTNSLKCDLPLVELEAARQEIHLFMRDRLEELSSQEESRELIRELSEQMSTHNTRIWELVQDARLSGGEVSQ